MWEGEQDMVIDRPGEPMIGFLVGGALSLPLWIAVAALWFLV
jgi:hypothetical protein